MRLTRRPFALALALLAAGTFAAGVSARAEWVHWQGRYFSCLLPDRHWQVVESVNGLDVSSPTGVATVSLAYATNGRTPYSLSSVAAFVLSPSGGLERARVLSHGAPYALGGSGTAEDIVFTAVRIRDRAVVRGRLKVEVYADSLTGAYAFAAYEQAAPSAQWRSWASTLSAVQSRITFYGHG